ncbi:MAG: FkbM family methyltransferase [Phycisphaerales bacterium]
MPTAAPFASCEKQFFGRLAAGGFSPACIVDIGGSNASWSTALHEVFPEARFDLFEPLAGRRADYDHILEWALRTHPTFHLHEVALGTTNGTAEFWNEEHGVGSSLLTRNAPRDQVVVVPVRRLDDYRAEVGIPQPQLVKIDVQGGELLVMQGGVGTIENADMLHIETWLGRGYGSQTPLLPEVMDFLRPMGHILVQLGEYWRKPDQELFVVDAFFAHRRLVDRLAGSGAFPWPQNWAPDT